MKFLKALLGIVVVLVIAFIVGSFLISKEFNIEHKQTIKANIQDVYNQFNTTKNWENWSYWNKLDTTMQITYNDIVSGVGASYSWNSDDKMVGNGKLIITESEPKTKVVYSLEFEGVAGSSGSYALKRVDDNTTEVTSSFSSTMNNMFEKWMKVLFMKSGMKKAFTESLNNMEAYLKTKKTYRLGKIEQLTTTTDFALTIREKVVVNDIHAAFDKNLSSLITEANAQGLTLTAAPFATYHYWDTSLVNDADIEFGIIVNSFGKDNGNIKAKKFEPTKAVKIEYFGDYSEDMKYAYHKLEQYIADKNLTIVGAPWEVYLTDSNKETDKTKWQTDIYFPIK